MTDLDPQISVILHRLVPAADETGEWERVLGDAGAREPRPRRWPRRRLALVLAAFATLAAALAFVPALAGQGYFWFLDYHAPKPTTPVVTVTSITDQSGTTWQVTAYQSEKNGLCIQLTSDERTGAGSCGPDLPINSLFTSQGPPHGAFILGPVTTDAQTVEITGAGHKVQTAPVPAPDALETDIKFYVAQLPQGMVGAPLIVKALDAQDDVVASWAVPGGRTP